MQDLDIYARSPLRRLFGAVVKRTLRAATGGRYGFHLFVRARKAAPFRWYFPSSIFSSGHLSMLVEPRDDHVVAGQNDALHLGLGWEDERTDAGLSYRRTRSVGDAYVLSHRPVGRAILTLRGGPGEIQLAHDRSRSGELVLLAIAPLASESAFHDVIVAVNADFEPGNPLHVRICG